MNIYFVEYVMQILRVSKNSEKRKKLTASELKMTCSLFLNAHLRERDMKLPNNGRSKI